MPKKYTFYTWYPQKYVSNDLARIDVARINNCHESLRGARELCMQADAAALVYVAGPFWDNTHQVFLCPECDDDRVTGIEGPIQCTVDWLRGQWLVGDAQVGHRTCSCWLTDPWVNEPGATNANRRFFYYRTLAILLGGSGTRVDLPPCVKEFISELWGDSVTGYAQN